MEKYDPNDHNPMISPMDEHYGMLAAKKGEEIFYRMNELYPELNDLEDFDSFPREFKKCRNFNSFVDKWETVEELGM